MKALVGPQAALDLGNLDKAFAPGGSAVPPP
jgi:hypothetical protein